MPIIMKTSLKTLVCLLVVAAFVLATGVIASAEDGFVFNVKGFNQTISGEDAVIVTTNEAYQTCNPKWAISVVCNIVSDNILKVAKEPVAGSGDVPSDVKVKENQVILVVHSSTSDTDQAEQYPNVFGKLAAMDLKKGHFLVLSEGLNLAAATGAGTVTVVEKEKNLPKTDDTPATSDDEPETSDEDPVESSEDVEVNPSEAEPVAVESSEEPSEPEPVSEEPVASEEPAASVEPAASEPAAESSETPAPTGITVLGLPLWLFIVLVCVIVIAVAVLIALVTKKKK